MKQWLLATCYPDRTFIVQCWPNGQYQLNNYNDLHLCYHWSITECVTWLFQMWNVEVTEILEV